MKYEQSMDMCFVDAPHPEAIVEAARGLCVSEGQGVMIMLADQKGLDLDAVNSALCESGIQFLGGVFPGVLWEARLRHEGAVLFSMPFQHPPLVLRDFAPMHLYELLQQYQSDCRVASGTVLLIVDGLSGGISHLLTALYGHFGGCPAYLGMGAGVRAMTPAPCLLSAQGVLERAAVVAFVPVRASVGVSHGWRPVSDPVLCTEADESWIKALNWQPAYEVYAKVVGRHAGCVLSRETFFDVAKAYPFGLYREGQEPVVRDPIAVHGDAIRCVGDVPENAMLHILHGTPRQLRDAAAEAATLSRKRSGGPFLVVDCVSRAIFQNDEFAGELVAIDQVLASAVRPVWGGALSLGEVALEESGLLELYNKTIVVGGFGG